ncbi:TetR family transcriptional regulator [Spirillospora sp. CA-294931]|uniref:TetR family transcriptional regulator n=1 Tax=Spirillospora sp. CA-294931 TaxID=3240042 RepID=UPI003D8B54FF
MTATAPEARPAGPGARPPGRRERKKQRTREALIDAAFALFAEKGFDGTTVEEIADAVDVSSRTFFRYFASKEDVALTFQQEQQEVFVRAFTERPADEPVVTALRRSAVEMVRAYEQGVQGYDPNRFECMMLLIAQSETLMAGSLEFAAKKLRFLTEAIADRMGVDPDDDLRPHVIASAAVATFRAAAESGEPGAPVSHEVVDEAFAFLEAGLNLPSAGAS